MMHPTAAAASEAWRVEGSRAATAQGVLSQTFKLVVTYDGKPNAGVPSEFIAKFLNPVCTQWIRTLMRVYTHSYVIMYTQLVLCGVL